MNRTILLSVTLLAFTITANLAASVLTDTPVQTAMETQVNSVGDSFEGGQLKQSDGFGDDAMTTGSNSGKKSLYKAILFSTLVPGGGQYYLGQKKTARYFFAAEALTWIGYASFRVYGNWKKDDYVGFAAAKANAQLEGRDDEFADLVGFYTDTREYNTLGRIFEPDRPYLRDTPENHWQWQDSEDQRQFRDLKNQSRESYRRSDFMLGVAVVSRIVSIIDAVRNVNRVNRRIGRSASLNGADWQLAVDPLDHHQQIRFSYFPGF